MIARKTFDTKLIYSTHLGKNIESIVEKALAEQNEEKQQGLSNAIAYYMKLAYNNWHKEAVSDQAIQSELDTISGGKLTFSNTPAIRKEREEFKTASGRKAFVSRPGGNNNKNNNNNNRNGKNNNRNNGNGNGNGNNGNNRNNFKKRY